MRWILWDITIKLNSLHTCINNVFFFFITTCTLKKFASKLDINKYILTIQQPFLLMTILFLAIKHNFNTICTLHYLSQVSCITGRDIFILMSINLFWLEGNKEVKRNALLINCFGSSKTDKMHNSQLQELENVLEDHNWDGKSFVAWYSESAVKLFHFITNKNNNNNNKIITIMLLMLQLPGYLHWWNWQKP